MTKLEARAKTFWEGSLKTSSIIRGFEVGTDKPKNLYGTNTAPAPAELFLASISACFLSTFAFNALTRRIELKEITTDIKGSIEMVKGLEKITKIDLKLKVWAENVEEKKLKTCFDAAKAQCSLTKTSNIPISFELKTKINIS